MQSNRLALVAPLCVILAAAGATNFACSNSDDDNNTAKVDSGVYIDGGIQEGVPPGSGYMPPAGGDDDDDDDDSGTTPGGEAGTPPTDGGGDTGTTPPTDAGDSGGGGTAPTKVAVLVLGDGTATLPGVETTATTSIAFYNVADGTSGGAAVSFPTTFSTIYNTLGGGLALSTDGHYLAVGGYNAAALTPNAATLVRAVARVSAAGAVDTTTIVGAFTGSASSYIRDVASVDGSGFWVTGTGTPDGTYYVPFGDTGTGGIEVEQTAPNPATTRDVGIFGGQLYISAQTTTAPAFTGVGTVGTGTPKTANGTVTLTVNDGTTGEPNPLGFAGLDTDGNGSIDTFYVADGDSGLHKWKTNGTAFAEVGAALTFGTGAAAGARAVTGYVSGTAIKLFVTTDDGTTIQSVTDTTTSTTNGTVGAAPFATAAAKTSFRGIAFAAK